MKVKIIYENIYKIKLERMITKIFPILVVFSMISATLPPAIALQSKAEMIDLGQRNEGKLKSLIDRLKGVADDKAVSSEKPNMERSKLFSRYVYLYTRYGDEEKWIKIDRILYAMKRLKGERGIPIDVDSDGREDVRADFKIRPKIMRKLKATFAYDTYLIIRKTPMCSLSEIKDFEVRLYFYLPRIFSEDLLSIGYKSPVGNSIPEYCKVDHIFIPHFIGKGEQSRYLSLEYTASDPTTKVVMLSGGDEKSGWTSVEAGHISISGAIQMNVNEVFEVDGEKIYISGKFYLNSKNDTIDIWWNTTRGFFKINGSGYFKVHNLIFDAGENLSFKVDILEATAEGFLEIERYSALGHVLADGILQLEDLHFTLNVSKDQISLGGTFDLSAGANLNNFMLSWDNDGLKADGNLSGKTALTIHDFAFSYSNFTVKADLMSFGATTSIEFVNSEGVILCMIHSEHFNVEHLYLQYGRFTKNITNAYVNGTLVLSLQFTLTGEQYVTAEAGHITIAGDTNMNVSITADINGTEVLLSGIFQVRTKSDTVDIWWNESEGFLRVNGSGCVEIHDFLLSVEDSFTLFTKKVILEAGGELTLDQTRGAGSLKVTNFFTLDNFGIYADLADKKFSIEGSFNFSSSVYGWINVNWSKENVSIEGDAYVEALASLTIRNFHICYEKISLHLAYLNVHGEGYVRYTNLTLLIESPDASVDLRGLYLNYGGLMWLSIGTFTASGKANLYLSNTMLNASGEVGLEIKDIHARVEKSVSIDVGCISFGGEGSIIIFSYLEVKASASLKITNFYSRLPGVIFKIGMLRAGGSVYLFAKDQIYLNVGGYLDVVCLYLSIKKSYLSIDALFAGGCVQIVAGLLFKISACVSITIYGVDGCINGTEYFTLREFTSGGQGFIVLSPTKIRAEAKVSSTLKGLSYNSVSKGTDFHLARASFGGKGQLLIESSHVEISSSAEFSVEDVILRNLDIGNGTIKEFLLQSLHASGESSISIGNGLSVDTEILIHMSSLLLDTSNYKVSFDVLTLESGALFIMSNQIGLSPGNETIYLESGGDFTIENFYMKLKRKSVEISLGSLSSKANAILLISDKTITAKASASLNLNRLNVENTLTATYISVESMGGEGQLSLQIPDERTIDFTTSGKVEWEISGYITSRGDLQGNIQGNIRLSDKSSSIPIEHVGISVIDGSVNILYIESPSLGVTLDIRGLKATSGEIDLDIHGTLSSGIISIKNVDATWSLFYIGIAGMAGINLKGFEGDISIGYGVFGEAVTGSIGSNTGFDLRGEIRILDTIELSSISIPAGGKATFSLLLKTGSTLLPPDYVNLYLDTSKPISIRGRLMIALSPSGKVIPHIMIKGTLDANNFQLVYDKGEEPGRKLKVSGELLGIRKDLEEFIRFITTLEVSALINGQWITIIPWTFEDIGGPVYLYVKKEGDPEASYSDSISIRSGDTVIFKAKVVDGDNAPNMEEGGKVTTQAQTDTGQYIYSMQFRRDEEPVEYGPTTEKEVTFRYTYNEQGTYIPVVTVYTADGTYVGSDSVTVDVYNLNVSIYADSYIVRVGENVNITAVIDNGEDNNGGGNIVTSLANSGRFIYEFGFGGGEGGTTKQTDAKECTVSHKYTEPGIYMPYVVVTDTKTGDEGGAMLPSPILVCEIGTDMEVRLTADKYSPKVGETVKFTAQVIRDESGGLRQSQQITALDEGGSDSYDYYFDFGDGEGAGPISGGKLLSIEHTYNVTGLFIVSVKVINKNTGVSDEDKIKVVVSDKGNIDIIEDCIDLGDNLEPGKEIKGSLTIMNVGKEDVQWYLDRTGLPYPDRWEFSTESGLISPRETISITFTFTPPKGADLTGYLKACNVINQSDYDVVLVRGSSSSFSGEMIPPVAAMRLEPNTLFEEDEQFAVTIDLSDSYDPDGYIVDYRLDFDGDGEWDTGWLPFSQPVFKKDYGYVISSRNREGLSSSLSYDTSRKIEIASKLREIILRILTRIMNNHPSTQRIISILAEQNKDETDLVKIITTVRAEVRDNDGLTDSCTATLTIYLSRGTPPSAAFTYWPSSPTTSTTITFIDQSTDPENDIVSWSWKFGDGAESNERNPKHRYSYPGTYTVTLTVTDSKGNTNSTSKQITVSKSVGYIAGYVKNAKGEPIEGVHVYTSGASDYTDSRGYYQLKLYPGTYTIKVEKEGYESKSFTASVEENQVITRDIVMVEIHVPPPPRITGGIKTPPTSSRAVFYVSLSRGKDCSVYLAYKKEGSESYTYLLSLHNVDAPFYRDNIEASVSPGTTYIYMVKAENETGTCVKHGRFTTPSSCFLEGTKVLLADGSSKCIEDIAEGEKILSFNPIEGKFSYASVVRVYKHEPEEMPPYYLVINNRLRITPNHLVYVNGRWVTAENIRVGDILFGYNHPEKVISIQKVYRRVTTYDISVTSYHTFFADNILVHNKSHTNGSSND